MSEDAGEIESFIPYYPDLTSDDLTYQISQKKEFHDLYLEKGELVPEAPGDLLLSQMFIQRLFSPHTPYKEGLLAHGPGTGKTCTASAVVEASKYMEIGGRPRKPTLVMVKSEELARNIVHEISKVCTSGVYVPRLSVAELRKGVALSEEARVLRLNREVAKTYEIVTTETFLSKLSDNDEDVRARYEDRDVVIDEAHTIRPQPKKKKGVAELEGAELEPPGVVKMYEKLHRFLHLTTGRKLLLTGTPVWDQAHEIASLMNLILPLDMQFVTGKEFDAEYFDENGNLTNAAIEEIKKKLHGRVSFLRPMVTSAHRIEEGTKEPWLKYIKIYPDAMSDIQAEYAEKAKKQVETKVIAVKGKMVERQTVGGTVYKLSRDAMNMILPIFNATGEVVDYEYGPDAFKKHIVKQIQKRGVKGKMTTTNIYSIEDRHLRKELTENLREYSAKFADIIEDIKAHPDEVTFVYNEEVTGLGGAIMFGLLLELHGLRWAKQASDISSSSKTHRFAVVTSDPQTTSQPKQIQDLLDSSNKPDNRYGERLQVIIGSEKIALGLSIKHVRRIHITMPHWNTASTDQAQARGIRFGGHDALKPEERIIHIFKHAAVETPLPGEPGFAKGKGFPSDASFSDKETMDIYIYRVAEEKEHKNSQIYRVLKETSVDCAAFYKRNVLDTDVTGSRECDYRECNYVCDEFTPSSTKSKVWKYEIPFHKIDYNTYNLFYSSDRVREIMNDIIELFRTHFSLLIDSIQYLLSVDDPEKFLLLHAIDTIINTRVLIRNRYGFGCYLKEEGNMLFLDTSPSIHASYANATYIENPLVTDVSSFDALVEILEYERDLERMRKWSCVKGKAPTALSSSEVDPLSYKTKIVLLEAAYDSNLKEDITDEQKSSIDIILDELGNNIYEMDDGSVVHVLYADEFKGISYAVAAKEIKASGVMRVFTPDVGWRYVDDAKKEEEYVKQIRQQISTQRDIGFEGNPYGVYGWISKVDKMFRLNVQPLPGRKGKVRGKACKNHSQQELIDIFVNRLEYFPVKGEIAGKKREELLGLIKGIAGFQMVKEGLEKRSDKELRGILSLMTMKIEEICELLRANLEEKGYLYEL